MTDFAYETDTISLPRLGLIVLQADETIEDECRALMPANISLLTSRVPSGLDVTPESLAAMEIHLADAARLFPHSARFDTVAYACTSGAAQIGPDRIAQCVRDGTRAQQVTDPVTALVAACHALNIKRLAMLSPYIAPVSDRLRRTLAGHGIATPLFGTFNEAREARVARISLASVERAAIALCAGQGVDALFLSCTNLRTISVIPALQSTLGLPVLSSNLVLAWHMLQLTSPEIAPERPRDLIPDQTQI